MLTLCAATLSNINVLKRLCCVHLRYVAIPSPPLLHLADDVSLRFNFPNPDCEFA
jgi:hypothetical protein